MGNLITIQHPCHPHTLTKQFLQLSPYTFKCYLCNKNLKYKAYYCYKCEFYVHEHCAEALPLIPNHPRHPQHPLLLLHGIPQPFVCDGCDIRPWSGIAYACKKCDFHLDFACAMSSLPRKEGDSSEGEEEEVAPMVQYFGHDHPLMCFDTKSDTGDYCWVCKEEIRGEGCGCFVCKLFLHNRCLASTRPRTEYEGESPVEEAGENNASAVVIEHPLHSQHPLYLFIDSVPRQCHACKSFCPSSMKEQIYWCYVCDLCRFSLDIACTTKVVPLTDPRVQIPRISHEHQLAHFFAKEETFIKCVVCKVCISGEFSGCPNCSVFFHNNCVGVPETFDYSLHPDHRLTLSMFGNKMFQGCPSCSGTLYDQLGYGCECGFAIHVECAQRMQAYHEEGNSAEIALSWHEHAVRLCHRMRSSSCCNACFKSVEGLCYVCPIEKCQLFLHRLCARLTSEIQHPYHPSHVLSLVPCCSFRRNTCDACHEEIWGFYFSCSKCPFYLDTMCASIIPDRKHVLHEHSLSRFEKMRSAKCNVCGNNCDSEFYRCVACDFNIHLPCMELPRTVKHKNHVHTMVLYDYYVEDDSGEYYCEFCEQRRNPNLGVYLCELCKRDSKLVAHIKCALSKSVLLENDARAEKADEKITRLRREADEARTKLEAAMAELEEAEERSAPPSY